MAPYVESETVELKRKYTDQFPRELVSFLNGRGGTIYLGVEDDGTVIGVQDTDKTLKRIADCISDQIEPSPKGEISSEILYEGNKLVIAVRVQKGLKPLYCVKKLGFSSAGCLVRVGTTCREMSHEGIEFRYKAQFAHQDFMLMARSLSEPLTFEMFKILLADRGYHIDQTAFEASFRLRRDDGHYNVLAELLADKNRVPLIFVKFFGLDKTAISERSDYGGHFLYFAYQELKSRLNAENICRTSTDVRPRLDEYLYDEKCVNEALVNMLVHNDWTMTEPLVAFYEDRVVFTSHGGLPPGLTEEEFYSGVSYPRNPTLMRVFLTLGIVEHTGHGVPMIVRKYGREAFSIHPSHIDVTIPFNPRVYAPDSEEAQKMGPPLPADPRVDPTERRLTEEERRVILELVAHPKATDSQLAHSLGISSGTVAKALEALTLKQYLGTKDANGAWTLLT